MPFSQDKVSKESPIWKSFRDKVFENQSKLEFKDWVTVAQSFSFIHYEDEILWKVTEDKMKEFLNENQGDAGILAGICFALEEHNTISEALKAKILREVDRNRESIDKNEDYKDMVDSFVEK